MNPSNWKAWAKPSDLPEDLRRTIHQGAFVPLLDPGEAAQLRRTILEVFAEAMDIYLEDHELRWRCDHVHRARPGMSLEAIFHAVGAELGVSVSRLRSIWFTSKRKSRMKELVVGKLKEAGQ